MKGLYITLTVIAALLAAGACTSNHKAMGTYEFDKQFLKEHSVQTVELSAENGQARLLAVPAWQGRVATSTSGGASGRSYGWLNHAFIASGERNPQFNNYGGEERFWMGPEGGEGSWFFAPEAEQTFPNWLVPAPFDTDIFEVSELSGNSVCFSKDVTLRNAKGIDFAIGMKRRVTILEKEALEAITGPIPEGVRFVAYTSENSICNNGDFAWNESSGMPSVWMLGMFAPSETTTVLIPYNTESEGIIVKDDYFGKIPPDRLRVADGLIHFTIDGKFRSKLGLPAGRSLGIMGALDPEQGTLTILKTDIPAPGSRYVNSQWGIQEDAFGGDALNAYNDGPTEDGTIMGPFFEMESSSSAAALAPGESLTHSQTTIHLEGPEELLRNIWQSIR